MSPYAPPPTHTLTATLSSPGSEDQPSPEEEAEEYDQEHLAEQQKRLNDVSRRLSRPYVGKDDIDDGVSME